MDWKTCLNGWRRIGASIPSDKPDVLGYGNAMDEQKQFLFGEEIGVIHGVTSKTHYLVTAFCERNINRDFMRGYRILTWDANKNTLFSLDKWQPGSPAAEACAFFKAHGAQFPAKKRSAAGASTLRFDPEMEAFDIEQACDAKSAQRSGLASAAPLSPYLLARCKR